MEKWIPIDIAGIENIRYRLISFLDDDGIILKFSNDEMSKNLKLSFRGNIRAYRVVQETYRIKLFEMLNDNYGRKHYFERTFFKVENSDYLKWCNEQSQGISEYECVFQFSIITDDLIIDIITNQMPDVTDF